MTTCKYISIAAAQTPSAPTTFLASASGGVGGKSAGITYGYALQPFLDEESTFKALSAAHPYLLQGQWPKASEVVVGKISRTLMKQSRRARRNPAKFDLRESEPEGANDVLERIRARHRDSQSRTQI